MKFVSQKRVLGCYVEKLTIRVPIQPVTQTIEKQITIETRANTIDGCYGNALLEGKTLLNGLEKNIRGGKQWESAPGRQSFRLGYRAAYHRT